MLRVFIDSDELIASCDYCFANEAEHSKCDTGETFTPLAALYEGCGTPAAGSQREGKILGAMQAP